MLDESRRVMGKNPHRLDGLQEDFGNLVLLALRLGYPPSYLTPGSRAAVAAAHGVREALAVEAVVPSAPTPKLKTKPTLALPPPSDTRDFGLFDARGLGQKNSKAHEIEDDSADDDCEVMSPKRRPKSLEASRSSEEDGCGHTHKSEEAEEKSDVSLEALKHAARQKDEIEKALSALG